MASVPIPATVYKPISGPDRGMTPPHGPSNLASRSTLLSLLTAELFLSGFEIMTVTSEMKISLLVLLSFQMIVLHENKMIQEAYVIFLFYVFF